MSVARKTSAILEVQRMASELPLHGEVRVVCPHCGGGSTHERSLSIRRSTSLTASYTCWRASCDLGYGSVSLKGDGKALYNSRMLPKDVSRPERRTRSVPLTERHTRYLKRYYGLTEALLAYGGVKSAYNDGRIIFGIYSPDRRKRGKTVRAYKELLTVKVDKVTIPKCINEMHSENSISQSWYYKGRELRKKTDTLIVVEDIVSALRVNPYFDSVALLGTSLTAEKQSEIRAQRYKNVFLCLDQDATKISARYVKNANINIPGLKVKFLKKDIKNMTEDELQTFLKEIEKREHQHTANRVLHQSGISLQSGIASW